MSKVISTVLNNEDLEKFENFKKRNGLNNYQALKELCRNCDNSNENNTGFTHDTQVDKKMLEEQDRVTLEKLLVAVEGGTNREKNIVKKSGAYHEENALWDIQSLFGGDPTFYEVKYFTDHWYMKTLIAQELAKRGVNSKMIKIWSKADETVKPKGITRKSMKNRVFH
jgi:hypothetical protein